MGRVYQAVDSRLGRSVALKVLKGPTEESTRRFSREAKAQASIDHPHVAKVFEVGTTEGRPYLVMQYVEGPTLKAAAPNLNLEEKVRVFIQTCEGLHAAHRLGILHRDIKPGNILLEQVDDRWHAFLLDFGLALDVSEESLTVTGQVMGTPAYMSPEQAMGEGLDRRSDVYALGATFFDVLCGSAPFGGNNGLSLLRKVVDEEAPSLRSRLPAVPQDLDSIILKCLEKDPCHRYDSARALGEDLQRFLDGESIQARRPSLTDRWVKTLRKNRTLSLVTVSGALVSLLLLGWGLTTRLKSRTQSQLAQRFAQEAERIEALLRYTRACPPHDIRNEDTQVRARMADLRSGMERLGPLAEGPGRYALGRVHLALGELEAAKAEFDGAWKAGNRGPEVAYSIGLCLARLYEESLEGLAGPLRTQALKDLEISLKTPALQHLRQTEGLRGESSAYAEGLLAWVEGRWEEAVTKARVTGITSPWFQEAHLLEGEVRMAEAAIAFEGGRHPEALKRLDQAGEALKVALAIGRSDPRCLEAEAARRLLVFKTQLESGPAQPQTFQWALEGCREVYRVQPDSWKAAITEAFLHLNRAQQLAFAGSDPRPSLEATLLGAESALALNPRATRARYLSGNAWLLRTDWEEFHGLDTRPSLAQASKAFRRGLEDGRFQDLLLSGLSGAQLGMAEYELHHGLDPSASYEQAEATLRNSIRLHPHPIKYANLGLLMETKAYLPIWKDQDPRPILAQGKDACRSALNLAPLDPYTSTILANLHLQEGAWLADHGADPVGSYQTASTLLQEVTRSHPDIQDAHYVLGKAWVLRARWESGLRTDPSESLENAKRALDKALALDPKDGISNRFLGMYHLERLRWCLITGQPGAMDLRAGRAALQKAERAAPGKAGGPLIEAELCLLGVQLPGEKRSLRHQGEAALVRAQEINPSLAGMARKILQRATRAGS